MRRAFLISLVLGFAFPAASHGAVTIGPPLPSNNLGIAGAGGGATFIQTALPGHANESPINGVLVRFRLQFRDWGNARLRVLRPAGGGTFSVVASDIGHLLGTTFEDALFPFPTRLPISAGDRIGIDADWSARMTTVPGATIGYWAPIKNESDPASAPTALGGANQALAFNADVEPDADRDGFGDETQDCAPANPALSAACPPAQPAKRRCKKGHRLKKVKTKSGKRKRKCVKKKKKGRR